MKNLVQNLLINPSFKQFTKIGLLCNQVSYDFVSQHYLFEILNKKGVLKRLFVPEHGLFGELQDQEKLNETEIYAALGLHEVEVVSLYQKEEKSLSPSLAYLEDLEALVIDIQDVGCRYFTFTSTIFYLFQKIVEFRLSLPIFVLNRPNPAGEQVEGIAMPAKYASFIGLESLPHRHGMTIAALCFYFRRQLEGNFNIYVISDTNPSAITPWSINPSPNIPNALTPIIYAGQCLFEGTTWSEGRGTTRPFELVGSPYISWENLTKIAGIINKDWGNKAILRPLSFIPAFHKFAGIPCQGFQLHVLDEQNYYSLAHSLLLLKNIAERYEDNFWRKGSYEFGSEKTAIELLAGDDDLLSFLYGKLSYKTVLEKLKEGEEQWLKIKHEIDSFVP